MIINVKNTANSYGLISKCNHLLTASLVIILLILGFIMGNLAKDNPYRMNLIITHKSLGLLALVIGTLTVLWSLIAIRPAYPKNMHQGLIYLANLVKSSLMLIIIVMPWSGYIMATANGRNASFFKLFNFPSLLHASAEVGKTAHSIHVFIAPIAGALVIIHILAALKHHYINKDNVLRRMLF